MKRLFALVLLLPLAAGLSAGQGDYGTESVFSLGAGARSVALGGAYTALSSDAAGAAFNPAGPAWMERQQASFLYYPLYEGTVMNSVTYGIPLLEFGTISGAFSRISTGGIQGYDSSDMQLSAFDYSEYKGSITYSKPVNEYLSFGVRVNAYGINMLTVNSAGFGADAGIIYRPFDFLTVGATLENVVKPFIALADESEDLPQRYTLGAAGSVKAGQFAFGLSADASTGERERFKVRAGAEASWNGYAALRAGYDDGQFCFGAGVTLFNATVDYAYVMNEYLGGLSIVDVSYSFGLSLEEQKKERAKEIRDQVKKLVDEKVSRDMTEKADILFEKAYAFFDNAKYEESLEELHKALEWQPKHRNSNNLKSWINLRLKELYYDAGVASYRSADYIRAIENFKILAKYDINFRDARSYVDRIYGRLGLSGSDAAYFSAGVEQYVKKQYNLAVAQWKKVKSGNAAVEDYIKKTGEMLRAAEAKPKKREITAADRERSEAVYYKAVEAYTSGDTDRAMRLWEEAVRINPDNIGAQRDLEKARVETEELRRRGIK